jgi:hypothetical protein
MAGMALSNVKTTARNLGMTMLLFDDTDPLPRVARAAAIEATVFYES